MSEKTDARLNELIRQRREIDEQISAIKNKRILEGNVKIEYQYANCYKLFVDTSREVGRHKYRCIVTSDDENALVRDVENILKNIDGALNKFKREME